MTMQSRDAFSVFGESFDIVATTDDFFSPGEYGLKKKFMSTACWRGYWCEVSVSREQGMVLNNLHIGQDGNEDTLLNGKRISAGVYRDVDMRLPFSGKMLFGNGQIYSVGSYMCEAAWGYKNLIELEFVDGRVVKTTDHSAKAKRFQRLYRISRKLRDTTEEHECEDGTGDYDLKMWWTTHVPSAPIGALLAPVDWVLRLCRLSKGFLQLLFSKITGYVNRKSNKRHQERDRKLNEHKFVFLTKPLDDMAVESRLRELLKTSAKKRVLVISPETFVSEVAEAVYEMQLEGLGFQDIQFANGQNTKRRKIRTFDVLFFPDGDPFALQAFVYHRLHCSDNIKSAVRRGAVCIAVGEAAVAMGDYIDAEHTRYANSCFRLNKNDDAPFGLHLFCGTVYLSKSKEDMEREREEEKQSHDDESFFNMHFAWPTREICLRDATMCVVNGDKEWYR